MTEERWLQVKNQIKTSFGIEDEYSEDLDPGYAEVLEFNGPSAKMKVKFVVRPKFLDKKTSYSNRAGSNVKVDYVYSEEEFVSHMEVYNWSEDKDGWIKVEGEALF